MMDTSMASNNRSADHTQATPSSPSDDRRELEEALREIHADLLAALAEGEEVRKDWEKPHGLLEKLFGDRTSTG
jgi:hypothetical protein